MKRAALVMLGNGFDLYCDLPTSYPDYIKSRRSTEMEKNGIFKHIESEYHDTWIDIEEEINNIITDINELENEQKFLYTHSQVGRKYEKLVTHLDFIVRCSEGPGSYKFVDALIEDNRVSYKRMRAIINKLIDELFEDIRNYLAEISLSPTIHDDLKSLVDKYEKIEVINYNYNDNFLKYKSDSNITYYHGKLDEKIILGHNNIEDPYFGKFNKRTQKISYSYNFNVNKSVDNLQEIWYNGGTIDLIILGHSVDKNDIEAYNIIFKEEQYIENIIITDYEQDSFRKITNLLTHLDKNELINDYSKNDKLFILKYGHLDKYDFENTDMENINKLNRGIDNN